MGYEEVGMDSLEGFRELPLLHTLSHVPVHERTLGVHQVELMVQPSPGLSDGGGVGEHTDSPLDHGEVPARHHGGWLVVDPNLEPCGAPVNKLDTPLGLDGGDGGVHILGDHVPAVQHAAGHVLPVAGSHFTIWFAGSKQALVISATLSCS